MATPAKFNYGIIFRICSIIACFGFLYLFPDVVVYVFLAFILALMGKPLSRLISKIKIYKWRIPYTIGAIISTLFFLAVVLLLIGMFVPLIIQEFRNMENINYEAIAVYLENNIVSLQTFLYDKQIIDSNTTIVSIMTNEIKNLINAELFSNVLGGIINMTSRFVIALFMIFFVGFFFIKDDIRLENLAKPFVNAKYTDRISVVSEKINHLLSRYCIGSVVRVLVMTLILYIGFLFFKIPSAGFLAFLGGILNIIPYLGPVIGILISILLSFIGCVGAENYTQIVPAIIEIVGIYVVANIIDNILLQPYIFSRGLKIHAIEVFLVIIIGGKIAGIAGMILAIPVYTILRTTVIEIYNYVNQNTLLFQTE